MSARAAWRLESLGFTQAFRYKAGKMDWQAMDWPMERQAAGQFRAGDVIRRGAPTCRLDDRIEEVRQRVHAAGWNTCVVVNEDNVVLGRLRPQALGAADSEATAEMVMEVGPTTYRPSKPLSDAVERMRQKKVGSLIITNSDGQLLGILYRNDAEQRLKPDDENSS